MKRIAIFNVIMMMAFWGNAQNTPKVIWLSQPVMPDETVMLSGADFGQDAYVFLTAFANGPAGTPADKAKPSLGETRKIEALTVNDQTLNFVLPKEAGPALYKMVAHSKAGNSPDYFINEPDIWWIQGDWGKEASPGGWLRIQGRCLDFDGKSRIALKHGSSWQELDLNRREMWTLGMALPKDLAPDKYEVYAHNGLGGVDGWRVAGEVVIKPHKWGWEDKKIFDIRDFGAKAGDGGEDSDALRAALLAAEKNKGGVVYFPKGRYQLKNSFDVPENTLLKGDGMGLSQIYWLDTDEPPEYFIKIGSGCGIKDMMMHTGHHVDGIICEGGNNILIQRFCVRLIRHQYTWLNDEQLARRISAPSRIMRVKGDNVRIEDCDFHASDPEGHGCVLYLQNGYVARNRFTGGGGGGLGRGGKFGGGAGMSERVIYEKNVIEGNTTMVWAMMRNLYFGHNSIGKNFVNNREGMSFDGGTMFYTGPKVDLPTDDDSRIRLRVPKPIKRWGPKWRGAVMIIAGRGKGQMRYITDMSDDLMTLTLDRPWDIEPDSKSYFMVGEYRAKVLFVGNQFEDNLGLQFYGLVDEGVIAENTCRRCSGGFLVRAMIKRPIWHTQIRGNKILDGMTYRNANFIPPGPAGLRLWGPKFGGGIMASWNVIRGCDLTGDTDLVLYQDTCDTLVENCSISHSKQGYDVDSSRGKGIVFRRNKVYDVMIPLKGDLTKIWIHPANAALMALEGGKANLGEKIPNEWSTFEKSLGQLCSLPNDDETLLKTRKILREAMCSLNRIGVKEIDDNALAALTGFQVGFHDQKLVKAMMKGKEGTDELLFAFSQYPWSPLEKFSILPRIFKDWSYKIIRNRLDICKGGGSSSFSITFPRNSQECPFILPFDIDFSGTGWNMKSHTLYRHTSMTIDNWLVAGPFENKTRLEFDTTTHPPELKLDITATYDTLDGKHSYVEAHPVTDRRGNKYVDLGTLFKHTNLAVAYAYSVVHAKRPMKVNFSFRTKRLPYLSKEPTILMVNDERIATFWQRNRTEGVTLKTGDNIVQIITCNKDGDWRFSVDMTVMEDVCAPGDIRVLSPQEIRSCPLLSPNAGKTNTNSSQLEHTCGISWELVLEDAFDRMRAGNFWTGGNGRFSGKVEIKDKSLVPTRDFFQQIQFSEPVSLPLRIEFDVRRFGPKGVKGQGMLGVFLYPDGLDDHMFWHDMKGSGYFLSIGWHNDKSNSIMRNEKRIEIQNEKESFKLASGQWYHVTAMFIPPRCILYVDDHKVFDYKDDDWIKGLDHFGLFSNPKHQFDNIKIFEKKKIDEPQ